MLAILKDDSLRDPEKIKDIEKILIKTKLNSEKINKLFMLGKRINDFQLGGPGGGPGGDGEEVNKMDEEMGVAVVFDDDDEDLDDDNIIDYNDDDNDTDEDEDYENAMADTTTSARRSKGLLKG